MNNQRRKELSAIIDELNSLSERLGNIMDDEQFSFDNLTEGLQQTMRGQQMEEAISNMEAGIDSIEEAVSYIEEAQM